MGSSTTNTQNNRPYAPAQPGIRRGLRDATGLYQQGGFEVQPYQGNMVAGYDPFRQQADQNTVGAFQGSLGAAQQAQGTLGGMQDPNQQSAAWDQIRQNTIASIMPGINSSFAGSGMTGSTLHQQNLASGLAQGLAGVENQNYQQGQQRALQAAGMVPGANNAAYGAVDYLRGAGQDRQGYQQDVLNSQILQDQQRQQAPIDAIQNYLALQSGAGSQFGVQSATQRNNPGLFGLLGAGLQAAPLFF